MGLFQTDDSQPLRVEGFQSLCRELVTRLLKNPGEIYNLSPHLFEELVMDRVSEMGLDVIRVSSTNRADGGVDFVFRSKGGTPVPIIGAVQVKHHQRAQIKTGVEVVEKLAGVLQRHRDAFNLGMVVTNTSFSSEAEWFAHPLQLWLRLRDGADVLHWIRGDFQNRREGDELPQSVRLTRNLLVDLKKR